MFALQSRSARVVHDLRKREVAETRDVIASSMYKREQGAEPDLQYIVSSTKFPDYIPFDCPDDTMGQPAWDMKKAGMNYGLPSETMGLIQMILMVMRDDDSFDWRQFVDGDRWLVKPLRPCPLDR